MLKLVPLLRDNFSIVANMVVPAVAQNMASNRPELRNLSLDIIDAMIDHIGKSAVERIVNYTIRSITIRSYSNW